MLPLTKREVRTDPMAGWWPRPKPKTMWALLNGHGDIVEVHRTRQECIQEAKMFWDPEWSWADIKRNQMWSVQRVNVSPLT